MRVPAIPDRTFRIVVCLREGTRIFCHGFWRLTGISFLFHVMLYLVRFFASWLIRTYELGILMAVVIVLTWTSALLAGCLHSFLQLARGRRVGLGSLFRGFPSWGPATEIVLMAFCFYLPIALVLSGTGFLGAEILSLLLSSKMTASGPVFGFLVVSPILASLFVAPLLLAVKHPVMGWQAIREGLHLIKGQFMKLVGLWCLVIVPLELTRLVSRFGLAGISEVLSPLTHAKALGLIAASYVLPSLVMAWSLCIVMVAYSRVLPKADEGWQLAEHLARSQRTR